MLSLLELPPELITACLNFLSVQDLKSVCETCTKLSQICRIEPLWQLKCAEDFQFHSLDGWNCSYYEIYSKVLYNYGRLNGLYRVISTCYGGLIHVKREPGRIHGREFNPQKDVRDPLLSKTLFTITLNEHKVTEVKCHQGYGTEHDAQICFDKENKVVLKCSNKKKHRHPDGIQKEKELFSLECQQRGMYASDLGFYKWISCQSNEDRIEMVPLPMPGLEDLGTGIRGGLFKGMYGGHGTEIVLLQFDEENKKAKALKVTGDPNVPAGEISIEVDLDRPMVLNRQQQSSLEMLRDIDTYDIPPDFALDKLPKQPFEVPPGVDVEDSFNVPQNCRLRFHSFGTVSPHGFVKPSKIFNHVIVFDEDLFGVLWLDLYSFGFFSRVLNDFEESGMNVKPSRSS